MQHANGTESVESFEDFIDGAIQRSQSTRSLSRRSGPEILTLPTVIHVIYSNPTENINEEQVLSQLEVLNQDYRRENTDQTLTPKDYKKIAVDTGIEFCLATVDPDGKPTNGIDRVSIANSPFTERYINEVIKPSTIWDPNRYLNIWVCNISGGILGYAQFPVSSGLAGLPGFSGTANADGVVINYNTFGTSGTVTAPFDKGRTATHEIGHWLGLRHIWGDGPCDVDDYCEDTPQTSDPHFACPPGTIGCNGAKAMIQNFMDYTDDACMNLFTFDQAQRMRAVLENSPRRKSLLNSDACSAGVEPPEPAFFADIRTGCDPLAVNFADQSEGNPESWDWTFVGGKPSSSRKSTVKVTYRKAGIYPVSLRVTNAGGTRSVEKEQYIQVYEQGKTLPVTAGFEKGTVFPPDGFVLHNPDKDQTWQQTERVGGDGKSLGALWLNNYDNNLTGSADWLITPGMDFSNSRNTMLSFDVAYAMYNSKYSDTLGVFVSTSCDAFFRNIYYKGGDELKTSEAQTGSFNPLDDEWRQEVIDLSQFDGATFVQIAFVGFSGHGNDLYLDNIRIGEKPKPLPSPDFLMSETSVCAGQEISFADKSQHNPTSWVWSFPGAEPASSTEANPTITYTNPGIYDVTLTVSNQEGENTITREGVVVVKRTPKLVLNASKSDICQGEEITLTASGAENLVWDLKGETIIPSGNNVKVKPATDMVYSVSTGDSESCQATASVTIHVRTERLLEITPPEATVCQGESVGLNATGAREYVWESTNDESFKRSNSAFVEVAPTSTSIYMLTGFNESGCELKKEITVVVEESPESFRINSDKQLICPGESVNLSAIGAAGYVWYPASSLNTTVGSKVIAAPVETTTYRVTASTESGCSFAKNITLQVAPKPEVTAFAGFEEICKGQSLILTANGAEAYFWTPAAYVNRVDGPRVEAKPDVSTTFVVVGSNSYGCLDTARVEVEVFEVPPLMIDATRKTICRGESVRLLARGAETYRWQSAAGMGQVYRGEAIVSPSRDAVYRVSGTDEKGCVSQGEIAIQVADGFNPRAGFEVTSFACAGQEVEFSNTSVNAVSFLWEFPGGTPETSTDANPMVKYSDEGVYDVSLTVTGCNGRSDTRTAPGEIVVTAPFRMNLLPSQDMTICRDEPFEMRASGAETYTWSPAMGLNRTTGNQVIASPERTTTYTVTGTDSEGCKTSKNVTLFVNGEGKKLEIAPFAPVICKGEAISLTAKGAIDYTWAPAKGLKNIHGSSVLASPETTTTYTVTATDLDGCVFTDTVRVTVRDHKKLAVTPDKPSVCEGESVELTISEKGVYTWIPKIGLSSSTGTKVVAFPSETTEYTITGTDESGCRSEAKVTVKVDKTTPVRVSAQDEKICAGQSTILTAEGGANYVWSPQNGLDRFTGKVVTATPKVTTTYTVSTSSGGCGQSQSITVEVLNPIPLEVIPPSARICKGSSVQLTASGGNGTYTWEGDKSLSSGFGAEVSVSPLGTTSYKVMSVDKQGCPASGSVTVIVGETEFLTASGSASAVCAGDEITLRAEGADTYQWLPAEGIRPASASRTYAQPQTSGIYTVIGRDQFGCEDTARVLVDVSIIEADFDMSTEEIDLAQEIGLVRFFDKTQDSRDWIWDFGEGSTSRQQNPVHVYTGVGTYMVTMRVTDGVCEDRMQKGIRVINSSSLQDLNDEREIEITRKTSDGLVDLVMESPRRMYLRLRLLTNDGEQLLSGALRIEPGEYRQQLDLSGFERGTYHLHLTDGVETYSREISYQ